MGCDGVLWVKRVVWGSKDASLSYQNTSLVNVRVSGDGV